MSKCKCKSMNKKMDRAHDDIVAHLECLFKTHSKKIGIQNLLYLIMFECFRALFDIAPTVKDARELMKDAMNHSRGKEDKPKKKLNQTFH